MRLCALFPSGFFSSGFRSLPGVSQAWLLSAESHSSAPSNGRRLDFLSTARISSTCNLQPSTCNCLFFHLQPSTCNCLSFNLQPGTSLPCHLQLLIPHLCALCALSWLIIPFVARVQYFSHRQSVLSGVEKRLGSAMMILLSMSPLGTLNVCFALPGADQTRPIICPYLTSDYQRALAV